MKHVIVSTETSLDTSVNGVKGTRFFSVRSFSAKMIVFFSAKVCVTWHFAAHVIQPSGNECRPPKSVSAALASAFMPECVWEPT